MLPVQWRVRVGIVQPSSSRGIRTSGSHLSPGKVGPWPYRSAMYHSTSIALWLGCLATARLSERLLFATTWSVLALVFGLTLVGTTWHKGHETYG